MKRWIENLAEPLMTLVTGGLAFALLLFVVIHANAQFPPTPTPPSGGGAGAATAANQATQITQETATATALGVPGTTASCASGSNSTAIECYYAMYAALQNGVSATGSAVPADAVYSGGNAQSSEPAATTTGNLTGAFYDLVGKQVTSPYANRENMLRCTNNTTGTGATTCTGMGAQGAGVKIYVTDIECGRTDAGTSAITVTFNDTSTASLVLPNAGNGGGNNKTFNVPLAVAANTALTFTASAGVTTLYCSAQGFKGY
jgi:hypothetical protein